MHPTVRYLERVHWPLVVGPHEPCPEVALVGEVEEGGAEQPGGGEEGGGPAAVVGLAQEGPEDGGAEAVPGDGGGGGPL